MPLGHLLLVLLVPLLGIGWVSTDKTVTLSVDGQEQVVNTHASTVEAFLERSGVQVGESDRIVPDPLTPVADGMVVEVVHAREITIVVGGEERTAIVTALSVEDVLRQLSGRLGLNDRSIIRPSRLTRITTGMTVEVRNPVPVVVAVDGVQREVITDAADVRAVLRRLDVRLGDDDKVTPRMGAPIESGMRIRVERVADDTVTREDVVPHDSTERPVSSLPSGDRRVVVAGVDGLVEVTEQVRRVDGEIVSREEVGREVVREARTEVVEVGTAEASRSAEPREQTEVAAAPAPAPAPRPAPQPEPEPERSSAPAPSSNTQSGKASYYHHPDSGGFTAAHRTLPKGTVVTVTNTANGKTVQVTINDRGPYTAGRIIDLNKPAFEQIASVDRGVINVRISW